LFVVAEVPSYGLRSGNGENAGRGFRSKKPMRMLAGCGRPALSFVEPAWRGSPSTRQPAQPSPQGSAEKVFSNPDQSAARAMLELSNTMLESARREVRTIQFLA
jgi:hypothetical protein